ncbi:MAG: uL30 family ribosomal protein [Nanoarchaeota archaeon]|nr:uL30 family ribosomal protein [Nanoarchaeota archaeon]
MTIVIIRIRGQVGLDKKIKETLNRLRIRRKYSCVIIDENKKEIFGMLEKIRNFVAYGNIDDKTLGELIEKRAQPIEKKKKVDVKNILEGIKKGEKYDKLGIKPFFRLHPPRGGIDSKIHFGKGKGVLGDNKEKINELIRRML